jgi:hypothetical protein
MSIAPQGPQPIPTAETAPYWRAALEGRLEIQYCRDCARHQFYPRPFCTRCLSDRIEWVRASGHGRIYTYTVCHVAAHPALESRVPYAIGMVELDEGVRLLAGIVEADLERLTVGAAVRVCFDRISDDIALPMFRLADGAASAVAAGQNHS